MQVFYLNTIYNYHTGFNFYYAPKMGVKEDHKLVRAPTMIYFSSINA